MSSAVLIPEARRVLVIKIPGGLAARGLTTMPPACDNSLSEFGKPGVPLPVTLGQKVAFDRMEELV